MIQLCGNVRIASIASCGERPLRGQSRRGRAPAQREGPITAVSRCNKAGSRKGAALTITSSARSKINC